MIAVVWIDVFDGDGRQFGRVDGVEPDGQRHALFQRRVGFRSFVLVFFVVAHLFVGSFVERGRMVVEIRGYYCRICGTIVIGNRNKDERERERAQATEEYLNTSQKRKKRNIENKRAPVRLFRSSIRCQKEREKRRNSARLSRCINQ